jgi:hypothetical protein
MPRYKTSSGDIYNIPEEKLQGFLVKYPDAILLEEEGKLNGPAEETAVAGPITEAQQTAVDTVSPLEDGSSGSSPVETLSVDDEDLFANLPSKPLKIEKTKTEKKQIEDQGFLEKLFGVDLRKGSAFLGESMASIPETIYDIFALPQNILSDLFDIGDGASSQKFKKQIGVENTIADYYIKEQDRLGEIQDIYNDANYESTSIYENFQKGNAADGFKLLASGIAESAPISLSIMAGGAGGLSAARLAAGSTVALMGPEVRKQREENPQQSETESVFKGFQLAAAESVFESIGTGTIGRVYGGIIKNYGVDQGNKVFKEGLVAMYGQAFKKIGAPVSALGEGIEEVATGITQNMINGVDPFENIIDTFIQGVGGGTLYGSPRNISQAKSGFQDILALNKINKELEIQNQESLLKTFDNDFGTTKAQVSISQIPRAGMLLEAEIDQQVERGLISKEKGDKIKINFRQTQGVVNSLKTLEIETGDYDTVVDLLKEKKDLKNTIDQVGDNALAINQIERVKEIDAELQQIGGKVKLGKTIAFAKSAEALGLKTTLLSPEKFAEQAKKDNIQSIQQDDTLSETQKSKALQKAENQDYSNAYGGYVKDGQIYINEEKAIELDQLNVGAHEVLHPILNALVGNKSSQEKIIKEFKAQLGEDALNLMEQTMKDRDYTVKNGQYGTEYLNVFSDLIADENSGLKFSENTWTKIGDFLMPLFRAIGFKKLSFKDGKAVFDFMREYSKSVEKGKLSKDIIKTVLKQTNQEGVGGEKGALQFSQTKLTEEDSTLVGEQVTKIKELQKEGEALAEKYGKDFIKSSTQTRLEQKLTETVKPALNALAENTTKRLYDKIAPDAKRNVSRAEYLESLKADWTSMIINEYDPTKQSVEKFLSTRGNLRANSLAKKLGIEDAEQGGIKKDVTEQKDLMADETTVEIEKAPSKLIDPTDLITNPDRKNKYIEAVKSKIKDLTPKQLSFKALKDLAPEVTAELFGVPLKKIIDATANLSKGDALNAQIFINKNAEKLLKLLPEGAVLGAASDKLIGTSTGVPKKLLEAFYDKNDRIKKGAGLSPFVKKKNISKEDFLNTFGIVDGKKDIDFNPRSGEAQAIKGLMSMFGNIMTNTVVRQEMSKQPGTEAAVQDIAAGKSDIQFSKKNKLSIKKNNLSPEDQKIFDQATKTFKEKIISRINSKIKKENKSVVDDIVGAFENNLLIELEKYSNQNISIENAVSIALENTFWNKEQLQYGYTETKYNNLKKEFETDIKVYKNKDFISGVFSFEKLVSKLRKLVDFEIKAIGFEKSIDYLKEQIKEIGGEAALLNFIKNESRAIRTFRYLGLTTNEALYNYLKKQGIDIKKYGYKLGKNDKGQTVIKDKDGNVITGYQDITAIKRDFPKYRDIINKEADEARLYIQKTLDYYKNKIESAKNEKQKNEIIDQAISHFKLLTSDQRGVIRKASKAGLAVLEFDTKDTILEHEFTVNDFLNSIRDYFKSNFDQSIIDKAFNQARVNLITKKIDQILTSKGLNKTGTTKERRDAIEPPLNELNKKGRVNGYDIVFQPSKTSKKNKEKILNKQFNDILQNKTGIASEKEYSDARAEVVGASKGKFNWFIPPTAEDFVGLLYQFLGKGKEGDKQMAWFKVNLLNPYARAMSAITRERVSIARNYRALKKELKIVPKNLKKKVPGEDFTVEQALRVHIWGKQGYDVPGLDNADRKSLNDYINSKPELVEFADKMILLNKDYAKPKDSWLAGTLTTDMLETLNTTRRAEFLKEWQENVDVVFSDKNLNKIEAAYGSSFRYALENILTRMKTGRNRSYGTDSLTGRVTDWLTNSIGAIMFFNTRSAVLQTLSAVNFINFGSNNILAAGKAFANQKQFWADFKTLYNSDFLVDRRDGLRLNVNESDIADMAKNGGVKGVVAELLKLGFTPTQIADSFAISSGGATFYRNTLNQYLKEGVDPKVAEELAFREFREIAEESQQSSRPDRISAQQAGPLGRIILAFANTPAQYARLIKKAASDLKNGRGDAKTNVSKLIYYGVAQNLIFNAMQQALFAMAFGDDEEEEETEQKKYINVANGMADSILRGMGISGAIVSVLKNTAKKLIERSENKQPDYAENALMELLKISPPVSSKASKIKNALRSYEWDKDEMYEKGLALDNPAYLAAGNVLSAATNIPLDRVIKKVTNVKDAMDEDVQLWQRIAMIAGWQAWELGIKEEKKSQI